MKTLSTYFSSTTETKSSDKRSGKVMEAELRWSWHTAHHGKAIAVEDSTSKLFLSMFPDSPIAEKFSCAPTKMTYLINFAIGPYVKEKIVEGIGDSYYSISFDETDGSMVLVVRYLNQGVVRTDMLDLSSLNGDLTAGNCARSIIASLESAKLKRRACVSDFSDSCNALRGKFNFK